ncbi:MAG: hypothetical protein ACLR3C_17745 [Eggerthella lenta]
MAVLHAEHLTRIRRELRQRAIHGRQRRLMRCAANAHNPNAAPCRAAQREPPRHDRVEGGYT